MEQPGTSVLVVEKTPRSELWKFWGIWLLFFVPAVIAAVLDWRLISLLPVLVVVGLLVGRRAAGDLRLDGSELLLARRSARFVFESRSHVGSPNGSQAALARHDEFTASFETRGRYRVVPRQRVAAFSVDLRRGQIQPCAIIRQALGEAEQGRIWLLSSTSQPVGPARVAEADARARAQRLNDAWGLSIDLPDLGGRLRPDQTLPADTEIDLGWVAASGQGLHIPDPKPGTMIRAGDVGAVPRRLIAWPQIAMLADASKLVRLAHSPAYSAWQLAVHGTGGSVTILNDFGYEVSSDQLIALVTVAERHGVSTDITGLLEAGSTPEDSL